MGLRDRLAALWPGGEAEADDAERFAYRCRRCDRAFESPERHVTAATCPDCGAEDVRVDDNPYL